MKKIAILTFQNVNNYGALLQAYALKTVCNDMGHQAHILNYYCKEIERPYRLFAKPVNAVDVIRQTAKFILSPINLYIRSRFEPFKKKYLQDTPLLTPDIIAKMAQEYDRFIAGSDQIFNTRYTGFDSNYFLAFNKETSKNYSYAASFGLQLEDLTSQEAAFIKEQLAHFNRISIREAQGVQIVNTLTGRQAEIHLDPTLLLTKEQWAGLARTPKYKNYIVLYLMDRDPQLVRFAKKLAKAKGCRLLYISHKLDIKQRVPVKHITPTPQEWLGLLLQAQCVVTNSFHGLVFAVNFNKPFFVGRLVNRKAVNSRLDNFLALTGLEQRIYTNYIPEQEAPIDWSAVHAKIAQARKSSLAYLQEITQ